MSQEVKPLPDEYLVQYFQAAKKAVSDTNARRKWAHTQWGSPVGPILLIEEIARLKLQLMVTSTDDETR